MSIKKKIISITGLFLSFALLASSCLSSSKTYSGSFSPGPLLELPETVTSLFPTEENSITLTLNKDNTLTGEYHLSLRLDNHYLEDDQGTLSGNLDPDTQKIKGVYEAQSKNLQADRESQNTVYGYFYATLKDDQFTGSFSPPLIDKGDLKTFDKMEEDAKERGMSIEDIAYYLFTAKLKK